MSIKLKRAYDQPDSSDGFRILVDRLWPRGISREKLQLDVWLKGIAPSTELRKWFKHDPDKFEKFDQRYRQELSDNKETVQELLSYTRKYETISLIYSAQNRDHNNAVVLKNFIENRAE